ncbi:hypothetical protein [Argonema galeatum]|uniref:hypothetical protein n=1 Tax=Argonema galeatum TaxID=2942762 RepID=UPI0020127A93|nr:hypothetical protein [Argonema galeatum]MCL1466594.1 hypothetical protein [Argonema galeatum A003/A1]
MTYLLDTCLISELVAKYPNQKVLDWLDAQAILSLIDFFDKIAITSQMRVGDRSLTKLGKSSDVYDGLRLRPSPHKKAIEAYNRSI